MNRNSTRTAGAGTGHPTGRGTRRGGVDVFSGLWFTRQDQVVRLALGLTAPSTSAAPTRALPGPYA